jgi:hypothetical protein
MPFPTQHWHKRSWRLFLATIFANSRLTGNALETISLMLHEAVRRMVNPFP